MELKVGDVITLDIQSTATNTFYVAALGESTALLTHPMACGLLLQAEIKDLNLVGPNLKDSTERCLDFANDNRKFLDFNSNEDLDALGIFFFQRRKLTPRQKKMLSGICGIIASVKFNNDLKMAISFINENKGLLDDFNLMWVTNLKDLFSGKRQSITVNQRSAVFNIAGYVLGETRAQTASR